MCTTTALLSIRPTAGRPTSLQPIVFHPIVIRFQRRIRPEVRKVWLKAERNSSVSNSTND